MADKKYVDKNKLTWKEARKRYKLRIRFMCWDCMGEGTEFDGTDCPCCQGSGIDLSEDHESLNRYLQQDIFR